MFLALILIWIISKLNVRAIRVNHKNESRDKRSTKKTPIKQIQFQYCLLKLTNSINAKNLYECSFSAYIT